MNIARGQQESLLLGELEVAKSWKNLINSRRTDCEIRLVMDWIGTSVAFVLGVLSTLFTERINLWLNRPGVTIEFSPDDHCLRFSHAHVKKGIQVYETESKFLRLRVSRIGGCDERSL